MIPPAAFRLLATLATLALMGVFASLTGGPSAYASDSRDLPSAIISTNFYDLDVTVVSSLSRTPWVTSVGGSSVLALGSDDGLLGPSEIGRTPSASYLGGSVLQYPLRLLDTGTLVFRELDAIDLSPKVGRGSRVRVLDFKHFPEAGPAVSGKRTILVSVAVFRPEDGCRSLQVFEVIVNLAAGPHGLGRTWFELPCIRAVPATSEGAVLHQSGGRLAFRKGNQAASDSLFVTTGDFQVLAPRVSVRPSTERLLSSVLEVSRSGKVTPVTSGLRNPQGLAFASLGGQRRLVATSHGPRGGDELVQVAKGADYGWPANSYGTEYGSDVSLQFSRPMTSGSKGLSDRPLFAWLPSIGTGDLLQVQGRAYAGRWVHGTRPRTGDLLVSGMATKSLYRIRWDRSAVRYVESIPVGYRVRSMLQLAGGELIAGTDEGPVLLITPRSAR